MTFSFDNSYAKLPETFYQKISPGPVANPSLIKLNKELAQELGLDIYELEKQAAQLLSGNQISTGAEPLAQAYAGHQFGYFVPQLGDGRACLLGEIIDTNSKRRDIQLKGSGQTRFSRAGDGRAGLGPVLREYLVSEAMHTLGVPTTRSLAIVATGEQIQRETSLPGAILSRVAASHIRIGTFEYFAYRQDTESLKILADYVIQRHYPEADSYEDLLRAVTRRQVKLIAKWMHIGFIHGVMNTDNMSIAGETIDYGPCAFMDFYNPETVFSSIDRYGRYAYQNQGQIGQWNLSIFANAILSLIDSNQELAITKAKKILEEYAVNFVNELDLGFQLKIGIHNNRGDNLAKELLKLMHKYRADFTLSFRYLAEMITDQSCESKFLALFDENNRDLLDWIQGWRKAIEQETRPFEDIANGMKKINPVFIPRNHLIEEAITAAVNEQDFKPFEQLCQVLAKPYESQEEYIGYMLPPHEKDQHYQTFCGT